MSQPPRITSPGRSKTLYVDGRRRTAVFGVCLASIFFGSRQMCRRLAGQPRAVAQVIWTASLLTVWLPERSLTPAEAGKRAPNKYMAAHKRISSVGCPAAQPGLVDQRIVRLTERSRNPIFRVTAASIAFSGTRQRSNRTGRSQPRVRHTTAFATQPYPAQEQAGTYPQLPHFFTF